MILNQKKKLRNKISNLVKEYSDLEFKKRKFIPGKSTIPPTGKVIGDPELQNMVEASLDGWLTAGRFNKNFEEKLAKFIGNNQSFAGFGKEFFDNFNNFKLRITFLKDNKNTNSCRYKVKVYKTVWQKKLCIQRATKRKKRRTFNTQK